MSTRIPPGKLSRGKGAGVGSGRMTGNASVAGDGRHALWGKRIFQAQVPSGSKPGPLGAVESGGADESGRGEKQGPDASATRQQGDGPDPAVSAGFSGRGGELAKAAFRNTASTAGRRAVRAGRLWRS